MDPKATNKLDPKLKEAYERIMGTPIPPPVQKKTSTQTPAQAPQTPKLQVQEVKEEPLPMPKLQQPSPLPPQPQTQTQSNEMVQSPISGTSRDPFSNPLPPPADIMEQNADTIATPKKKSKLMSIFLIFGGLIFFVLYGVIWAKVFNLF